MGMIVFLCGRFFVALFDAFAAMRPQWRDDDDD
jgi:hypothetical protein